MWFTRYSDRKLIGPYFHDRKTNSQFLTDVTRYLHDGKIDLDDETIFFYLVICILIHTSSHTHYRYLSQTYYVFLLLCIIMSYIFCFIFYL